MEHLPERPSAEQLFGAMVKRAREGRAWTQEDLRRRLAEHGIALEKTAMIRLESGRRPIRFNEVVALSRILDLDLSTTAFVDSDHLTLEEYHATEQQINELHSELTDRELTIRELDMRRSALIGERAALATAIEMLERRLSIAYRYRSELNAASSEFRAADIEERLAQYEKAHGKEFADRLRDVWRHADGDR